MACPECGNGTVNTDRGPLPISLTDLSAAACDATAERDGKNHATIPPRLRRQALARDHHRCRASGCRRTRFLHVHHLVPREDGGPNTLENLITLCSGCHRVLHRMRERSRRVA
jgi:5-methylcytosine-specific restriction endonuclease McrA